MFICYLTVALIYQITVDQVGRTWVVKHNTFKYFSSSQNIYTLITYLITFYIPHMVHFVGNITYIGCFMVLRVRNQTEFRLVIFVNNTLCPGKHRKNKLGTLSNMAHTSPHIFSTLISPGCKIVVLEQIQIHTHYLEFHEKSTCLTCHFYSTISMVRRLPKKWYTFLCLKKAKATQLHLEKWTYMLRWEAQNSCVKP